jgi:hypothetical protein
MLDVGQWDTHVANGATFPLAYDLMKTSSRSRSSPAIRSRPARKTMPATDQGPGRLAEGQSRQGLAGDPDCRIARRRRPVPETDRHPLCVRALSRRRPGDADLVAGQIDMMIIQAAVALLVRGGAIKAYAVTAREPFRGGARRPAVDEAGLPGLHISGWFALFAPRRAEARHRQAQRRRRRRARRPGHPRAVCRSRPGNSAARAADAGGARRLPQGRGREVVPIIKAANIKGE